MPSTSKSSRPKRLSIPELKPVSSTGPIFVPLVDSVPLRASDAVSGILPDHVAEPIYILRGNKVRCSWCGATYKTRKKYTDHFEKRHLNAQG